MQGYNINEKSHQPFFAGAATKGKHKLKLPLWSNQRVSGTIVKVSVPRIVFLTIW